MPPGKPSTFCAVTGVMSYAFGHPPPPPWTVTCQAPVSMGFYWSGVPFPPPGDLPNPGIESASLHCRRILYC